MFRSRALEVSPLDLVYIVVSSLVPAPPMSPPPKAAALATPESIQVGVRSEAVPSTLMVIEVDFGLAKAAFACRSS